MAEILEQKFLQFEGETELNAVDPFVVDEFFKNLSDSGIKMRFDDENNFQNWMVNPLKTETLSLVQSKLYRYRLKKPAYDKDMQSDFPESKPIIPVKRFLCQLKALIEGQPDGITKADALDNRAGYTNLFNVDLSEIGDNRVVIVRVRGGREGHHPPEQHAGEWLIFAVPTNFSHPRTPGCLFFSPC